MRARDDFTLSPPRITRAALAGLPSWVAPRPGTEARLAEFGAVVFTTGFRPDYSGWVRLPVFDADGFPMTHDDLSTAVPGLFFCGVHFLRNRRSSLMWGVGDDAHILVRTIVREHAWSRTDHA